MEAEWVTYLFDGHVSPNRHCLAPALHREVLAGGSSEYTIALKTEDGEEEKVRQGTLSGTTCGGLTIDASRLKVKTVVFEKGWHGWLTSVRLLFLRGNLSATSRDQQR